MRKEIKETLRTFIETFQKEILPIAYSWLDMEKEIYTVIKWYYPDVFKDETEGFYGTGPGMWIQGEGEYFIFLPKTTKAYISFFSTAKKFYKKDYIPEEVMLHFDGKGKMKFKFASYVDCVTNEAEMLTRKELAEELVECLEDITFYEGDDEPKESVYTPGDIIPSNYFVGIKGEYEVKW